jgi:hypothetical protein
LNNLIIQQDGGDVKALSRKKLRSFRILEVAMPPAATTRRVDPIITFLKKGSWTSKNFLLGYFGGLNFLRVLRVLRGLWKVMADLA